MRLLLSLLCLLLVSGNVACASKKKDISIRSKWQMENAERRSYISVEPKKVEQRRVKAYVIPITEQIGTPQLYILRRGLKDAIADNIDVVILEMDTPGGDCFGWEGERHPPLERQGDGYIYL